MDDQKPSEAVVEQLITADEQKQIICETDLTLTFHRPDKAKMLLEARLTSMTPTRITWADDKIENAFLVAVVPINIFKDLRRLIKKRVPIAEFMGTVNKERPQALPDLIAKLFKQINLIKTKNKLYGKPTKKIEFIGRKEIAGEPAETAGETGEAVNGGREKENRE